MSTPAGAGWQQKLTVAMVVRDAADLLAETLESVKSIADEIVVVDTGSQDNTIGIAQSSGARVIPHAWTDDFSAARNFALSQSTGNWVFWLDAGETIEPEAAMQLRVFVNEKADPKVAYLLNVEVPASPGQVSGERIAKVRLVPNQKDLRFEQRVGETLLPAIVTADMTIEALTLSVQRGPREHDPKVRAERARRNQHLAQLQIKEQGETPEMLRLLAEASATLGEVEKAKELFSKAIETAPRESTTLLESYYGLLTSLDGSEDQRETQVSTCLAALEIFPLDAQLLCALGSYMLSQQRPDLAVRSYTIAVEHGQLDPQTWHLADAGEVAAACLSLTLQLLNQSDEAQKVLADAVERFPQSERLGRQLLSMYIKNGQADEALAQFDKLPRDIPHREALRSAVRGSLLAAQKNWMAALPYLQTAHTAGCRDTLCLRWLAVAYLSTGEPELAETILAQWRQQEPENPEVNIYLQAIADSKQQDEAASQRAASSYEESGVSLTTPSTTSRHIRVDEAPHNPSPAPLPQPSRAPSQGPIIDPPAQV